MDGLQVVLIRRKGVIKQTRHYTVNAIVSVCGASVEHNKPLCLNALGSACSELIAHCHHFYALSTLLDRTEPSSPSNCAATCVLNISAVTLLTRKQCAHAAQSSTLVVWHSNLKLMKFPCFEHLCTCFAPRLNRARSCMSMDNAS